MSSSSSKTRNVVYVDDDTSSESSEEIVADWGFGAIKLVDPKQSMVTNTTASAPPPKSDNPIIEKFRARSTMQFNPASLQPGRELFANIDVGITNIGMTVRYKPKHLNTRSLSEKLDLAEKDHTVLSDASFSETLEDIVILERSTLLFTLTGKYYKEYSEAYAEELVYNWIGERWEIFKRCKFVVIEKQRSTQHSWQRNRGTAERACVIIETCMKSFFRAHVTSGGPAYYVIAPEKWQKWVGREVGNHDASFTNAERRQNNKNRSMIYMRRKFGDEMVQAMREWFFWKYDDIQESYLISEAVISHWDEICENTRTKHHHSSLIVQNEKPKNVQKRERQLPILGFSEYYTKSPKNICTSEHHKIYTAIKISKSKKPSKFKNGDFPPDR